MNKGFQQWIRYICLREPTQCHAVLFEEFPVCCCNCSLLVDFLFLPECHNISHVTYFDSSSFHAVCVCWLEILWQELFAVTTDFTACKRTAVWASCSNLKLFFLLWLISFTSAICHHTNNETAAAPDSFDTTISINEVITERIIKCHLRLETRRCFKHTTWLKALTCQCYELWNNAVLLISTCLLHTDQHCTDFKSANAGYTALLTTHTHIHTHLTGQNTHILQVRTHTAIYRRDM